MPPPGAVPVVAAGSRRVGADRRRALPRQLARAAGDGEAEIGTASAIDPTLVTSKCRAVASKAGWSAAGEGVAEAAMLRCCRCVWRLQYYVDDAMTTM